VAAFLFVGCFAFGGYLIFSLTFGRHARWLLRRLRRTIGDSRPSPAGCFTLHHTPYTLHPTPYTPHPSPYTYTLHPTSYILHPTP